MLHDTYGFPVEVTREVLAERGLSLDEAGFEAAMDAQRDRAREAMQGYERVVAAFRDQEIRSRFVGYEREQVETRIVAIEPVPDADEEVYVVLAENPFYATGGGQVADEGWISSDEGQLEVFDAIPAGDYQVLRARVERSSFQAGDAVTASINRVRRQQIEANHTATHILHWALRAVLGQDVVQAGSYVGPDRLRFDYRYAGKVTEEEIRRVQEISLQKITENQPVRYFTTTLEEARNLGAMMLFGEKYADLVQGGRGRRFLARALRRDACARQRRDRGLQDTLQPQARRRPLPHRGDNRSGGALLPDRGDRGGRRGLEALEGRDRGPP